MDSDWNILTVKHQHEFRVGALLAGQGLPQMVPAYRSRRQWSDRVKDIRLPLFSGYVFTVLPVAARALAWRIPGVTGAVRVGGEMARLSQEESANLCKLAEAGAGCPWPALAAGDRVRITGGPLRGVTGVLAEEGGAVTVVVNVSLLGRAVGVGVDRAWVRPETRGGGR